MSSATGRMSYRGSQETLEAVQRGQGFTVTTCFACCLELVVIDSAEFLVCPDCQTVSPFEGEKTAVERSGVALGIKWEWAIQQVQPAPAAKAPAKAPAQEPVVVPGAHSHSHSSHSSAPPPAVAFGTQPQLVEQKLSRQQQQQPQEPNDPQQLILQGDLPVVQEQSILQELEALNRSQPSQEDPYSEMQAKEREKELRKQALSQRHLVGASSLNGSNHSKQAPVDTGMLAKEREKQLRKDALSQGHLNVSNHSARGATSVAAKPAPAAAPMKMAPADTGMEAKEREKQLRKQTLSQRSLNVSNHSMRKQTLSQALSQSSLNVSNHSKAPANTGMEAKEREKQLRKEALSQRHLNVSNHSMSAATAVAAKPAPAASPIKKAPADSGMEAKEREKQLRKDALSQRHLNVSNHSTISSFPGATSTGVVGAPQGKIRPTTGSAASKPGAVSVVEQSSVSSDSSASTGVGGMQAKEREKELRKQALSQRNLVGASAAAKAPPPPVSPAKMAPADTGMQAKEREKQLRKEALSERHLVGAAAAKPPPVSRAKTAPVDTGMEAKDREKMYRKGALSQRHLVGAVAAANPSPVSPAAVSSVGAHSATGGPRNSKTCKSDEEFDGVEQHLASLPRNSATAKNGPGAGTGITAVVSQPPLFSGSPELDSSSNQSFAVGANTIRQTDNRIAQKVGAFQNFTVPVDGQSAIGETTIRQTDIRIAQKVNAFQNAGPVDGGISLRETEDRVAQKVGAFSATRFEERQKGLANAGANGVGFNNDGEDLEAPPCPAEQAPLEAETRAGPSFHLTQQPQQAPVLLSSAQQEQSPLLEHSQMTMESAVSEAAGGVNLIEATLVVEEMVEATVAAPMEFQEDEVMKIRQQSAKETARIKMWRIVVSVALLATAIAVTTSTYKLLVKREDQNFRTVYYQFATTVADAAIEQQSNIRESLRSLASTVATMAEVQGNGTSPWPYFTVKNFETLAQGFKKTSNAEFIAIQNFVTHDQRADGSYIDFITPRYEGFVQEAHMQAYGSLDNLNISTSNYQPFIAQKLKNKSFVPDIERENYFCRTHQSPPARKYGPTINNNLIANKVIGNGFAAVLELRNENVFTPIKPFANVPPEEHAKMHSNGAEGANNPHSFTFHPVHRVAGDDTSDIVAMFACATAWDFSMLNLLPDNVKGMYCVVQNTCNQTVTYRIDGGNATYLGDGELQPTQYDDMAVSVDLNLQENPMAASTPGHCIYSMKVYPSKDFEGDYTTNTPAIYAAVVAGTFVLIAAVLFIYDLTVTKRNEKMIYQAAKTNAILSKFVPDHLRDRIMGFDGKQGGEISGIPRSSSQDLDMSVIMDKSKIEEGMADQSMALDKSIAKSMLSNSTTAGPGRQSPDYTRRGVAA